MKTLRMMTMLTVFGFGPFAFSHGEDKPGPHGGEIRMPGAYHTELVAESRQRLKVYLLDLDWKNPSVHDSDVEVTFRGERETSAKCKKGSEAYLCSFDRAVDLNTRGTLRVQSMRKNQRGSVVEYPTPLKKH